MEGATTAEGWIAAHRAGRALPSPPIDRLVNFFTFDPSPVMAVNGNTGQAVTYLAGNIVKAEHGFRIDPGCFLYVPLRLIIAATSGGTGTFALDMPSDLFAAFDDPRLAPVHDDFNATLASLLRLLDLPVPADLDQQAGPVGAQ